MLIELHSHTAEHSSCSSLPASDLVRTAAEKNADGIVLTDHHFLWNNRELEALRASVRLPPGFLLLSGQEASTPDMGDVLVYGATESIPWGMTLKEIRTAYPAAALVWAHPFRWGQFPVAGNFLHPALDAIEVLNGNQTDEENERGCAAWKRYKFTAIAGSDTHELHATAILLTQFHEPFRDMAGLITAIKNKKCEPATK